MYHIINPNDIADQRRQLVRLVLGFLVGKKANNGLIALRGSSPLSSRSPRYSLLFPTKEPGPRLRTRSRDEKMI